jgi:Ser/Thr protein kinase RdoA (MazF antagonist)
LTLAAVLPAWGIDAAGARVERAPSGLIQETWFVDAPGRERLVVQRMHPIFGEAVLEDLEAVTEHLAAKGLATPRLRRTRGGARGTRDAEGKLWRALAWLPGYTVDRVRGPEMARAAGGLVAAFHAATADCAHEMRFTRAGVHDTAAHLAKLERLLGEGPEDVRSLGEQVLEAGRALEGDLAAFAALPRRLTHGDLKISNVLFEADDRAVALIDLDTLGRLSIAYELGDAWRSWCNPLGEDVAETRFDLAIFEAAAAGYAAAGSLSRDEQATLVAGVHAVCVELAARFCADAVEDRYFGWDPARFPSRREHNRVRAEGQLALARQVAAARGAAERTVARLFAG